MHILSAPTNNHPLFIPPTTPKTLPISYEDLRALDGGVDGMDTIEAILWLTAKRLRPATGALWLEVDPSHPALIEKYLAEHEDALRLKFVASYKDMFGKDRFVEIVRV